MGIENLVKCPSCKKGIKPHFVCRFCGFYAKTSKKTPKK
ncbi:MAG: 50S ribosomal protein L32 [Patescibacteria group bacterium]